MEKYREAGESCALRGIVNNQVWLAQSVIVVEDGPAETILLLRPGAQCAYPEGYGRWKDVGEYKREKWHETKHSSTALRELAWQTNRVLMFLEPEKYYSCCLFWDQATDQFNCYYINFQLPYWRSHCGFDTLDLELDIVIDPQYNWKWKDVEDYQESIREGGIHVDWVKSIEQSQAEVFDRINQRRYPLDGSWLNWVPDPTWVVPTLPEKWRTV